MEKKFLGRDAVLTKQDVPERDVYVPEWDGWVKVRGLTAKQRDEFEKSIMVGKGRSREVNVLNLRAKLAARTVVGEDGQPLFAEADVPALSEKSASAIERIVDVALELSGMTEADQEELLKNSGSGQPDGLLSA